MLLLSREGLPVSIEQQRLRQEALTDPACWIQVYTASADATDVLDKHCVKRTHELSHISVIDGGWTATML